MSFFQKLFGPQKELHDLKSNDGNVRLRAVKALGEIADSRTVDALIAMLSDKYILTGELGEYDIVFDTSIKLEAAKALGNIGDKRAVEALIMTLADHCQGLEERALIDALKRIGKPSVEFLINALKSDNKRLKFSAIETLVTIKDDKATEPLIATLRSMLDEPNDREFAIHRLQALGLKEAQELAVICYIKVFIEDINLSSKAADGICYFLSYDSIRGDTYAKEEARKDARRKLTAELLRKYCDTKTIDALIKAIPNHRAIEFLGMIGNPQAIDSLISTLEMAVNKKDSNVENSNLGTSVIIALKEIGDARAISPLIATILYNAEHMSEMATWALPSFGAQSVEPLLAILRNPLPKHIQDADNAFAKDKNNLKPDYYGGKRYSPSAELRTKVVKALSKIGDVRALDDLIRCLKDEEHVIQITAADGLQKIGNSRAIEPLISALRQSPNMPLGFVNALKALTGKDFGNDVKKWEQWWSEGNHTDEKIS